MTDRTTLEDLDATPDDGPWCCTGNMEDCALCTDPNPSYPWICPGHERTAENERIVASWTAVRAQTTQREERLVEAHRTTIGQLRDAEARIRLLEAEVAAARKYAGEMRDFCSPHGVSAHYADQLEAAMDRAQKGWS